MEVSEEAIASSMEKMAGATSFSSSTPERLLVGFAMASFVFLPV